MNKIPYILNPEASVTLILDGKQVTILKDSEVFQAVILAVKEERWDDVRSLSDKITAIKNFVKGDLEVRGNAVFYKGEAVHGHVINRILEFIKDGFDVDPLLNFLEKIMQNPSFRCIEELFTFLDHKNMPIDPDGDFYAYKAVTSNWMDKHTRTISNHIGAVVEMPRCRVDDNSTVGCSKGLHAGSISYVKSFANYGDKIVLVKINPADVVSVPNEDTTKLRCCKYVVISEMQDILPSSSYSCSCDDDDSNYDDDYDDGRDDICPECDSIIDDDDYAFCPHCGYDLK